MNADDYREWTEAVLRLPERTFFNLMRLYLGEIKTPFNKQRLVERLIGFLSKEETQQIIVKGLDELDLPVLTAVHILPITTRGALRIFLSSESSLHTRLTNMEERLLLYRTNEYEDDGVRECYKINPFLYKIITPLLDAHGLFLPQGYSEPQTKETLCDDIVLAGLYTFLLKETSVLKANGSFKIRTEKLLKAVFQDSVPDIAHLRMLCTGLQHLGLVIRDEVNLIPQQERWEQFFQQNPFDRKLYISAAVCGHVRRDVMRVRARFFADFLTAIDPRGLYEDKTLKRFFDFLFQQLFVETNGDISLFPDMYSADDEMNIINSLKTLGFLLPVGEYWQLNTAVFNREMTEQPLIAAPSFEITMLPYTSFEHIFPALSCMEPLAVLTTGRFEITRAACLRCFERGSTDTALIALLDAATGGTLPQNIKVSMTEWYLQCTAVGLYHGFVLTVAEDKRKLFQKNAGLRGIVHKELADGVYLIKQMDLEPIRAMVKSAGLEVTFYNVPDANRFTAACFAPIECRPSLLESFQPIPVSSDKERFKRKKAYREHIQELEAFVDTMPITHDDKQNLKEKIAKRLIVTRSQLWGKPVTGEVREVSGLDFLGKIHLAEAVIAEGNSLEVSAEGPSGQRMITGIPIMIEKTAEGAVLLMQVEGKRSRERISIAHIAKMRAFRDSLFS